MTKKNVLKALGVPVSMLKGSVRFSGAQIALDVHERMERKRNLWFLKKARESYFLSCYKKTKKNLKTWNRNWCGTSVCITPTYLEGALCMYNILTGSKIKLSYIQKVLRKQRVKHEQRSL